MSEENKYTFENEEYRRTYWHTCSHVLAQAVKRLHPEVKLAIGPSIENGFYYDLDAPFAFTQDDLAEIEGEMRKICKEKLKLERFELPREEALKYMEEREEPYKVELINDLPADAHISFYKQGEFVDLCAGPHLDSTGRIKGNAIKLTACNAAYWRGDSNRQTLQRIYGVAFPKKEDLDAYLKEREDALKRDHNKLGRELEYFTTVDCIGQGLPIMLPKGARVVIGILVALLIIVALVVGAFLILNYDGEKKMTNTTATTDYQETIEYKGHTYVYNENVVTMAFLGVDKRELGKAENHTSTNGMADTDIVVAINKVSGKTSMIAVPRDAMVDVDVFDKDGNFKKTKEMELCIAYAYGDGFGTSCKNVTKSISRILYNVPIDKYFALDLNGIQPINDSIGGVKVQSLYDLPDYGVKKGDTVHLTGDLTEAYVRTRDMDNLNASLNRTQRQVQYLNAFADKVRGSVTSDFSVITNLYNTASDYCTTDLTVSNVTYLGSLLLQKGVTDFQSYTLEGKMKAVDNKEFKDYVYAGFYPDKDSLMQTVLDVFYTRIR